MLLPGPTPASRMGGRRHSLFGLSKACTRPRENRGSGALAWGIQSCKKIMKSHIGYR
jgi:hypothetical protein